MSVPATCEVRVPLPAFVTEALAGGAAPEEDSAAQVYLRGVAAFWFQDALWVGDAAKLRRYDARTGGLLGEWPQPATAGLCAGVRLAAARLCPGYALTGAEVLWFLRGHREDEGRRFDAVPVVCRCGPAGAEWRALAGGRFPRGTAPQGVFATGDARRFVLRTVEDPEAAPVGEGYVMETIDYVLDLEAGTVRPAEGGPDAALAPVAVPFLTTDCDDLAGQMERGVCWELDAEAGGLVGYSSSTSGLTLAAPPACPPPYPGCEGVPLNEELFRSAGVADRVLALDFHSRTHAVVRYWALG